MKIKDALSTVARLYVEAAPFIYYVEENLTYVDQMEEIIDLIEDTPLQAVSSVITLTEVLNHPIRQARADLEQAYRNILISSGSFGLVPVNTSIADLAAHLRARYNLRTPDALHVATALEAKCDAFLTNDLGLKRVTEIRVLVLDELELSLRK